MYFSKGNFSDLNRGVKLVLYAALLILIAGVGTSIWITIAISPEGKLTVDVAAFEVVRAIHVPVVAGILQVVSKLGSVPVMATASFLIVIYFLFLSPFSRWLALYFALAMGGVSGLTKLAKTLTSRDRPEFLGGFEGVTSSYPSGHASGAVVFYGFMIYMIGAASIGSKWKWIVNTLLVLIILGISFSRVYLGVHYFTDIVSGIFLGCLWLLICIIGVEATLRRQTKKEKEEAA
ncbi:phosphatase PAP2 family protein [Halobacillus trueperi]|uniref:phosphatase PAP2 family protein n=1 Tax=Halobacillus trueperi TaxID=156205 RepID=UPI003735B955